MEIIILQFQTPQDMAAFKKVAGDHVVKMDIKELRIECNCTFPDIAQAMNYYGAVVLDSINK